VVGEVITKIAPWSYMFSAGLGMSVTSAVHSRSQP
jgi:hypothetical protein